MPIKSGEEVDLKGMVSVQRREEYRAQNWCLTKKAQWKYRRGSGNKGRGGCEKKEGKERKIGLSRVKEEWIKEEVVGARGRNSGKEQELDSNRET